MISIRELDFHGPEYADLFHSDRGAMLYESPFWLEMLNETLHLPVRLLGTWEGEELGAAIPFMVSPGNSTAPVINSLPFFGSIGGVVSGKTGAGREIHLRSLLSALLRRAGSEGAVSVNVICRPNDPLERVYRETLQPDFEDARTTFVLDLPSPSKHAEEIFMRGFAGRTRTGLRKAMKQDFKVARVLDAEGTEILYRLHCENMDAIGGLIKPRSFMDAVKTRLGQGSAEIWVVKNRGEVVAGALFFVIRDMAEYYMSGLSRLFREYQPLSLLIFEAIKDFSARGIRLFNFGGTWPTQEGLRRFKSGWGARTLPYRYFVKCGGGIDSLLDMPAQQIFAEHPFFYVVPYSSLRAPVGEGKKAALQ